MSKVVLLLSGGLDSVVLLHHLVAEKHEVIPVFVDYGQDNAHLEWGAAYDAVYPDWHRPGADTKHGRGPIGHIQQVKLGYRLGSPAKDLVVPGRNLMLIAQALPVAVRAGAHAVAIGCNANDYALFPDCRAKFFDALNHATMAAYGVEVWVPWLNHTKDVIVKLGRELGVNMAKTVSCYVGNMKPCGECLACTTRKEAGA